MNTNATPNTSMAHAMTSAGIKPKSVPERVWLYLKNHPKTTTDTLSKVLMLDKSTLAPVLTQMYRRGMVSMVKEPARVVGKITSMRNLSYYSALGDTYEWLPLKKEFVGYKAYSKGAPAPEGKRVVVTLDPIPVALPAPVPTPAPVPVPVPVPAPAQSMSGVSAAFDADALIESLNPRQAKELYLKLRELFA